MIAFIFKKYFDFALKKGESKEIYHYSETKKDHGKIKRREYFITYNIDFVYRRDEWKNLSLIDMTRDYRQINDNVSIQKKYYISDLNSLYSFCKRLESF